MGGVCSMLEGDYKRVSYNVAGKLEGKKTLEIHWNIWENNIEMDQKYKLNSM
jgi:hypothetical protein